MDKKTSPGGAGSIGGKGFTLVMLLGAAVIGITAWILLSDADKSAEEPEAIRPVVDISEAVVTMIPRSEASESASAARQRAEQAAIRRDQEREEEEASAAVEPEPEPEAKPVFNETVTGYVWPVRGEIEVPYSIETLLYDATMADWRTHDGIDIACSVGDEVIASAGGTVVGVRHDDMYGTVVELDHANGVHTLYCNLAAEPPVEEGDVVTMGQIIGSVGGTALAETNEVPHLHFAMTLDGRSADPMDYLDQDYAEDQ